MDKLKKRENSREVRRHSRGGTGETEEVILSLYLLALLSMFPNHFSAVIAWELQHPLLAEGWL